MIKGKHIVLRALEPEDVNLLFQWENDASLWHLSNTTSPFSRFVLEQYVLSSQQDIYTNKQLRLMIDLELPDKTYQPVGTIDLYDFDPHNLRAGVGILISRDKQQNGYAADALDTVIKYAKEVLHLHQLYCGICINNNASLKLFRKFNFELTGIKKDWIFLENSFIDEYILQLILNH
jgi:diamine N-acetyltransferase